MGWIFLRTEYPALFYVTFHLVYFIEAIRAFIEYYNYWRYHEGLGNVTPYDMYTGKHLEIIQRRKEAKSRTLQVRKNYNRAVRKQDNGL